METSDLQPRLQTWLQMSPIATLKKNTAIAVPYSCICKNAAINPSGLQLQVLGHVFRSYSCILKTQLQDVKSKTILARQVSQSYQLELKQGQDKLRINNLLCIALYNEYLFSLVLFFHGIRVFFFFYRRKIRAILLQFAYSHQ